MEWACQYVNARSIQEVCSYCSSSRRPCLNLPAFPIPIPIPQWPPCCRPANSCSRCHVAVPSRRQKSPKVGGSEMDAQSYRDHCLIVLGSGLEAEELLLRRRLGAGGRAVHFLTEGPSDARVEISRNRMLEGCFWALELRNLACKMRRKRKPSHLC